MSETMGSKIENENVLNNPEYCKVCASFMLDHTGMEMQAEKSKEWPSSAERYFDRKYGTNEEGYKIDSRGASTYRLIKKWVRQGEAIPVRSITEQANKGCVVCKILDEAVDAAALGSPMVFPLQWEVKLRRLFKKEHSQGLAVRVTLKFHRAPDIKEESDTKTALALKIYNAMPGSVIWHDDIHIYSADGNGSPFKAITYQQPLPQSLDDPRCFELVRRWIEDCTRAHPDCEQNSASELPTRLIDVDAGNGKSCRLYIPKPGECAKYVALSHCWGHPDTVPRTNLNSLELHQIGISEEVLSKTFRDAVEITRQLGIQYLWIDALCIIQDSHNDWAAEAAKMGQYYEGAHLTISAVSSLDGRGGCLNERKSRSRVPLLSSRALNSEMFVNLPRNHVFTTMETKNYTFSGFVEVSMQHSLFKRKWCYQERILSRRILHYFKDEIVWECKSGTDCECGGLRDLPVAKGMKAQFNGVSKIESASEALKLYSLLVGEYSTKQLTVSTDILPAFSAVARQFANKGLGEYYAVLWSHELVDQLCWRAKKDDTVPMESYSRPSQYCAPTWSWASIQGSVEIPSSGRTRRKDNGKDARVLSVEVEKLDDDDFGRIKHASITLNVCMISVETMEIDTKRKKVKFDGMHKSVSMLLDVDEDWKYLAEKKPKLSIACLRRHREGDFGSSEGSYIILEEISETIFRRIGLYEPETLIITSKKDDGIVYGIDRTWERTRIKIV